VRAIQILAVTILGAALASGVTGCGDDGASAPNGTPAVSTRPAAAGATGVKAPQLAEKLHVEDRVICPSPDRPSDPKDGRCDPKAPSCAEHLYCLTLAQGSFCEPCPERDRIRHAFKERDFAVEQNRDPFEPPSASSKTPGPTPTERCVRPDQIVATSYSYADLKLVGIVAQGTLRKALMMGGPLGYIIKRGDCVGKEKALVKDIGTGYITFVLDPNASAASQRAPEELSVQLNPKQLAVADPELPMLRPRTAIIPVVPPPATVPPRALPAGSGSAGSGSGGAGSAVAPAVESPPVAPKKAR
jgi:Tfp pilus assembly protein PilP